MSNLPPMSGRAFRDYFMIEDREGDGGNLVDVGPLAEPLRVAVIPGERTINDADLRDGWEDGE